MKLQKYLSSGKHNFSSSPKSDCLPGSSSGSSNPPWMRCFSFKSTPNEGRAETPRSSRLTTSFKSAPRLPSRQTDHEVDDDDGSRAQYLANESGLLSDAAASELVQELMEVFRVYDSDGDGKISMSELGYVLTSLGSNPSEEELRLLVEEVDSNGDGYVDLSEFLKLHLVPSANEARVEELKSAFSVFDINNDGLITAEELYGVLAKMGEEGLTMEACCNMIKALDIDGDGFLNFAEFEKMMGNNVV